jgi:TRAP-type C4-dicarboxylate transport system substrate-binding protein
MGSGAPPSFPANDPCYTTFIAKVAEYSKGEVTARQIGMEVANLTAMISNIQTGTLDIGNVIAAYFPAQFPNFMLLGELSVLGDYGNAMAAATTEFIVTCADCQAEMKKNGMAFLGAWSTSTFELITKDKKVRTPADLAGLRIRSVGASTAAWLEAMGAVAVNVPFNEEYQALSTGLADGTMASPAQLISNRLVEIVKYYTPMPVLAISTSPNIPIRLETWQALSVENRTAVLRAAVDALVLFEPASRAQADKGVKALLDKGGELVEPGPELLAANADFRKKAIDAAIAKGKSTYGIADADEKVRRYVALVEKWNKIVPPIQDDAAALSKAVWDEVFAKVDVNTYGL